ncbi:methylated-DNA-[protein]-cysteine S-methyltransferase [Bacillus tianshenii]|uniref:Methylated-DNA--protein-cysteine methyltransferase n=1 Tax=Sutcliffiella tianshenii TaxID=1463404 RepID=A0ABS2NZ53_9BACI|nr:methylated-DNA--[protein]-cysteine S-methyltransferase [Bacillus tianshenii]MBM7619966.1 methylated-DNA-[protein]-cysteine S-methyltransferase [Bacillus tianshenii]
MSSGIHKLDYKTPIGLLEITGTEETICSIMFEEREEIENLMQDDTPKVLALCWKQLDEYFKGERSEFTFPYTFQGTVFQQSVWNALKEIPYAETGSYKDIAVSIGNEKAIRAVGSANGRNRLTIVIPCHRIIGSNGTLTGYAGGLWRKEWLLNHERTFK